MPGLEIDWLAQEPVTARAARARRDDPPGQRASSPAEAAHIDREAGEHDLHAFQAIRRMDEILCANFMLFHDVVREERYDVWIGDEAWELDYFLHENPELKTAPYAWLTDFVGFLPMPAGGEREAFLTADYNAEMIEHVARYPRVRDRAIFVGDPDDVVPDSFGPGLPEIRDWTERHYDFSGYVPGFDPDASRTDERSAPSSATARSRSASSRSAAPASARRCCAASIEALPLRAGAGPGPAHDRRRRPAHRPGEPAASRRARGARLRPRALPAPRRLRRGGRAGRPDDDDGARRGAAARSSRFPLASHFEQHFHVRHRLDRYGARTWLEYAGREPAGARRRDRAARSGASRRTCRSSRAARRGPRRSSRS